MRQAFSNNWKSSRRPAKQRKYLFNAPFHQSRKYLSAHLSKDLKKKHGKRSMPVAKGDRVKVIRGQFKGRENKVDRVDIKESRLYITGIDRAKKDGSKSQIPVRPSNVIITELNLEDKKRKAALERKSGEKKANKKESKTGSDTGKTATVQKAPEQKASEQKTGPEQRMKSQSEEK